MSLFPHFVSSFLHFSGPFIKPAALPLSIHNSSMLYTPHRHLSPPSFSLSPFFFLLSLSLCLARGPLHKLSPSLSPPTLFLAFLPFPSLRCEPPESPPVLIFPRSGSGGTQRGGKRHLPSSPPALCVWCVGGAKYSRTPLVISQQAQRLSVPPRELCSNEVVN